MMLLSLYQIFSSLRSQLHFFVHFFFTFMEYFFCGHPIYLMISVVLLIRSRSKWIIDWMNDRTMGWLFDWFIFWQNNDCTISLLACGDVKFFDFGCFLVNASGVVCVVFIVLNILVGCDIGSACQFCWICCVYGIDFGVVWLFCCFFSFLSIDEALIQNLNTEAGAAWILQK